MKVIIKGFRCHTDAEYSLCDGKLILMSGPSGAGKSTVMQAIYWCLYGGMRAIYPKSMKSGVISVTVQMNNCTVYRQGRPNLFRVVTNNPSHTYEDDVAQGVVDRLFGPKDLWKACCYIDQNSRCALLSGSNNERMDLLNTLSFSTDNPEACISRIDTELKSLRERFTALQAVYTSECQTFGQELSSRPVDPNVMKFIPDLANMRIKLPTLNAQLIQLDRIRMEQMRLIGMKKALNENLSQHQLSYIKLKDDPDCKDVVINNDMVSTMRNMIIVGEEQKLSQYRQEQLEYVRNKATHEHATKEIEIKKQQLSQAGPDESSQIPILRENIAITDEVILKIEQTVSQIQDHHKRMNELRILEEKLSQFSNDLSSHLSAGYTENDLWKNRQQEQSYTHNYALSQKLDVGYTEEEIQRCRQEHSQKMEFESSLESRLSALTRIKALESELLTIPSEDHEQTITDAEVLQARDEYTRLSQSSDLLSCPHCGKSVRYVDNSLQPDNTTPVTPDQLKVALEKVSILFSRQTNQKKAVNIRSQIETLMPACGDRQELENLKSDDRMSLQQRQILLSKV